MKFGLKKLETSLYGTMRNVFRYFTLTNVTYGQTDRQTFSNSAL